MILRQNISDLSGTDAENSTSASICMAHDKASRNRRGGDQSQYGMVRRGKNQSRKETALACRFPRNPPPSALPRRESSPSGSGAHSPCRTPARRGTRASGGGGSRPGRRRIPGAGAAGSATARAPDGRARGPRRDAGAPPAARPARGGRGATDGAGRVSEGRRARDGRETPPTPPTTTPTVLYLQECQRLVAIKPGVQPHESRPRRWIGRVLHWRR